jgi:hypothetical protein
MPVEIATIIATVTSVIAICKKVDDVLTRFAEAHDLRNDRKREVEGAKDILITAWDKLDDVSDMLSDSMASGQRDDLMRKLEDVTFNAKMLEKELNMPDWKYLVDTSPTKPSGVKRMLRFMAKASVVWPAWPCQSTSRTGWRS